MKREIVPSEMEPIRQEPGRDMAIYGSASIVRAFTKLGLIDEYQILVHSLVLGGGKPLFNDIQDRIGLRLVEARTPPSGVILLSYQPACAGKDTKG